MWRSNPHSIAPPVLASRLFFHPLYTSGYKVVTAIGMVREKVLRVRVSELDLARWQGWAKSEGVALSVLVRSQMHLGYMAHLQTKPLFPPTTARHKQKRRLRRDVRNKR